MPEFIKQLLSDDGAALRTWLEQHTPDSLHGFLPAAPLWLLVVMAVVVAGVLVGRGVKYVHSGVSGLRWVGRFSLHPIRTMREVFAPKLDTEELKAKVTAHGELLVQMRAQLDKLLAGGAAAGAQALTPLDERARQHEAMTEIVTDLAPAAQAAAREIAAGNFAGAIATLKRDARADLAAAADKWRRLAALARGVDDAEALAAYEEAFKLQPEDFWTRAELAELYLSYKGDFAAAQRAAEAVVKTARSDRERSIALYIYGDVLRLGRRDMTGAIAQYRKGAELLEKEPASAPDRAWHLAAVYDRIGDALLGCGELVAAVDAYLTASEHLRTQDDGKSDGHTVTYALSVLFNKMGSVHLEGQDPRAASKCFEQSRELAASLVREYPNDPRWHEALAISLDWLGNAHTRSGDHTGAVQVLGEARTIWSKLLSVAPKNAELQRNFAICEQYIGDALQAGRDWPAALDAYTRAAALMRGLVARDPGNLEWRRDLAIDLWKLAQVLANLGDGKAQSQCLHECYVVLQALHNQGVNLGSQVSEIYEALSGHFRGRA